MSQIVPTDLRPFVSKLFDPSITSDCVTLNCVMGKALQAKTAIERSFTDEVDMYKYLADLERKQSKGNVKIFARDEAVIVSVEAFVNIGK